MPRWEVRTRDQVVAVEAANWLLAVGSAMAPLGLDPAVMARMACDIQPDGVVRIVDPKTDTPMLVRRLEDGEEPAPSAAPLAEDEDETITEPVPDLEPPGMGGSPVAVVARGHDLDKEDEATARAVAAEVPEPDILPPATAAPSLTMPAPSNRVDTAPDFSASTLGFALRVPQVQHSAPGFSQDDLSLFSEPTMMDRGESEAPEDLAETLFMRGMDISMAEDIPSAAQVALDILLDTVEAESAAVLYGGLNDPALRFIAARGPSADQVADVRVPYGKGIAGFCHDTGMALMVHNAAADPRHHAAVDSVTGYRTRAVLAVALKDGDGGIHGCLELLNPPRRFENWHMDAVTTVAAALADYVRMRV